MEPNSENIFLSSSASMEDDIFQAATQIIQGADYSATRPNFSCFQNEDLLITDNLWNDEYDDPLLLPQQYHIPQAMEIPQISSFSPQSDGPVHDAQIELKGKSAFRKYEECSTVGAHLYSASKLNQKSIKKCMDFLGRMYKSSKSRSYWEVDDGVLEEADAFTRRISERKRRGKLSQLFMDLRSVLPHNSNSKKVDQISTLSNAMMELNQKQLLIGQLEQQNKELRDSIRHNISESCSSLSHSYRAYLGKNALMASDCEEAVVLIKEGSIPQETIIQVILKKKSSCTHMDAVATLVKYLREIKLEVELVRIESREVDATKQAIEVTIRSKTELISCTQTCHVGDN